jgi:hypothetical protein
MNIKNILIPIFISLACVGLAVNTQAADNTSIEAELAGLRSLLDTIMADPELAGSELTTSLNARIAVLENRIDAGAPAPDDQLGPEVDAGTIIPAGPQENLAAGDGDTDTEEDDNDYSSSGPSKRSNDIGPSSRDENSDEE